MLPELGQILMLCALLASLLQAGLPLVGAQRNNTAWMAVARPAAFAQLLLVAGHLLELLHQPGHRHPGWTRRH